MPQSCMWKIMPKILKKVNYGNCVKESFEVVLKYHFIKFENITKYILH